MGRTQTASGQKRSGGLRRMFSGSYQGQDLDSFSATDVGWAQGPLPVASASA